MLSVPDGIALLPLQAPPLAVQLVALVEVQDKSAAEPELTEVGVWR